MESVTRAGDGVNRLGCEASTEPTAAHGTCTQGLSIFLSRHGTFSKLSGRIPERFIEAADLTWYQMDTQYPGSAASYKILHSQVVLDTLFFNLGNNFFLD